MVTALDGVVTFVGTNIEIFLGAERGNGKNCCKISIPEVE